jgi:hypothetical protein
VGRKSIKIALGLGTAVIAVLMTGWWHIREQREGLRLLSVGMNAVDVLDAIGEPTGGWHEGRGGSFWLYKGPPTWIGDEETIIFFLGDRVASIRFVRPHTFSTAVSDILFGGYPLIPLGPLPEIKFSSRERLQVSSARL